MTEPSSIYRARLQQRRGESARLEQLHVRMAWLRLAAAAAAVLLAVLAWRGSAGWWTPAIPALGFALVAAHHDRILRSLARCRRAQSFYERGLARIEDRWMGTGSPGDRFRSDDHLYANDLDLFGRASLFELLSTARTLDGEARLAAWLLAPADPDEILERQRAVADLASALDLRERLAVAGDAPLAIDTGTVIAWAEAPPPAALGTLRATSFATAAAVVLGVAYLAAAADLRPLLVVLIFEVLAFRSLRQRMEAALHLAGSRVRDLDALSELLDVLRAARFTAPRLARLSSALEQDGVHAATAIRRLHRLSQCHDWEHSLPLAPVVLFLAGYVGTAVAVGAVLLLWSPFLTVATEAWRKTYGHRVRGWVSAVADVEALASIAAYRFEHPADPFPDVVPLQDPPDAPRGGGCFDGVGLGHPLLPAARIVRNDVRLTPPMQLLVVSGSNMSGKSTLLRTVGINAVLALAGAPVRAASLRLTRLAVGATLRIQDSLQEGRSRFYAEITRIRALTEQAAGPAPLLFLLDELFHGTNSHDRLVGAAGVLRTLLDRGAIGLVTTHDLALTTIADELAPRTANVHFEDWFEGGEIQFDYRLKPGPVRHSNAIALMRAVGLEVGEPER